MRLNVVRPGRPEQCQATQVLLPLPKMSQCSPAWKTGTMNRGSGDSLPRFLSQCSPAWKTGTIRRGLGASRSFPRESQCSPAWKTGTIVQEDLRFCPVFGCLNVVRPGRPEQLRSSTPMGTRPCRLNVVRPGRPEQSRRASPAQRSRSRCLNVVRPGRPEQSL